MVIYEDRSCHTREEDDVPSITCPVCAKTSYHPKDVEHRYCAACQQFHDLLDGSVTASQMLSEARRIAPDLAAQGVRMREIGSRALQNLRRR